MANPEQTLQSDLDTLFTKTPEEIRRQALEVSDDAQSFKAGIEATVGSYLDGLNLQRGTLPEQCAVAVAGILRSAYGVLAPQPSLETIPQVVDDEDPELSPPNDEPVPLEGVHE